MRNGAGRFQKLFFYKAYFVLVVVFLYSGYVEARAGFTIKERFLFGYQIQEDFEIDWMGCLLKCIDHSECVSYNYQTKKSFCQLNSHGIEHASMAEVVLHSGTSYIFHQLKPVTNGRIASPRTPQKCKCNCGADTQCTSDNKPGLGDKPELAANSCQEILQQRSDATDGPYYLKTFPGNNTYTYCHMTEIPGCDGGGWTLVIKMDGNKQTFKYDSSLWTGMQAYEPSNGADLSETETLLPTYWSTPFSRLCLGMKHDGDTNWIPINYNESFLFSIFSNGHKEETRLDVSQWKSLLRNSSLQTNCTTQGFNILPTDGTASARIGITGFPGDCKSSSASRIGFGTGGTFYGMDGSNTCGNEARNKPDNGERSIKAFGYIFIQ